MPELFAPDELATFSSMPDLLEKIAFYLGRPGERHAVAQKGKARVLAEHTYQQRMQSLLTFLKECFPGWPAQRAEAQLPEDLPQELRAELSSLLSQLHLPADSSFSDVVAAVRSREGELSGIETALLFLDEWQKQYKR
jgi:spore maturation protein CgeB